MVLMVINENKIKLVTGGRCLFHHITYIYKRPILGDNPKPHKFLSCPDLIFDYVIVVSKIVFKFG